VVEPSTHDPETKGLIIAAPGSSFKRTDNYEQKEKTKPAAAIQW